MRVTGGTLGGRKLAAPRGDAVRPTTDRVRESLFARLGDLSGARVLDLYAGSGALGIEALSRGAEVVVFVERAPASLRCLRGNLASLALTTQVRTLRGDAVGVVRRLAMAGECFDLVLMDPPYGPDEAPRGLRAVAEAGLLASAGMLVVEASHRHPPGEHPLLSCLDERVYGDSLVVRYTMRAPGEGADPRTEAPLANE